MNSSRCYGYRNATHNSVARAYSADKAETLLRIATLETEHPGNRFELVEFEARAVTRTEWKSGQGRAGNSFPVKHKMLIWVPLTAC